MTDITPEYLEKINYTPESLQNISSSFSWAKTHEGEVFWDMINCYISIEQGPINVERLSKGVKILNEMRRVYDENIKIQELEDALAKLTKETAENIVKSFEWYKET